MGSEARGDADLVEECLHGHAQSWEELVRRYAGLVYSVAKRYHLDEDDAADVFQNTWSALWVQLPEVRSRSNLSPWLLTVAARLSYQQHTRQARQALHRSGSAQPEEALDPDALPGEQAVAAEEADRLRAAMARLPHRCRELLGYLFYDPRAPSYAEIGQYMRLSPHTIGPLRSRCLQELRGIIELAERQRGQTGQEIGLSEQE